MSFSDLPLLRAGDDGERESAARQLALVRTLTRRFFDAKLKDGTPPAAVGTTEEFRVLGVEVSSK